MARGHADVSSVWRGPVGVRSHLSDGAISRVIFCIAKGDMVLLHGFFKTTQKTPQRDIDLAHKRRKEIE